MKLILYLVGIWAVFAHATSETEEEMDEPTQSIDEIIAAASEVDSLAYLTDLEGQTIMQEMDMLLTLEQWRELQKGDEDELKEDPSNLLSRQKRKAIKSNRYRWTNKIIPYKIAPGVFSSRDQGQIQRAITEWQTYTCLKFRPRSSEKNYVYFDNGSGCYSYVGMTGGAQTIGLAGGCRHKGVIVHEIGHAVGFHHEQNRPDRDSYVRINFQNIPQSVRYNFKKYPYSAVGTFDVPYDYGSVMHYGGRAFSNNGGLTIQTLNPKDQNKIGNRQGLSFKDIKLANIIYNCHGQCDKSIKCPGNGFLGKDCQCYCPGSPVKKCDTDTGTGGKTAPTTRRPVVIRTTAKPKPAACKNMNQHCYFWAKYGHCKTSEYMKIYCKKACNLCEGSERKTCSESSTHCKVWSKRGYCDDGRYKTYMGKHCQRSCGMCSSDEMIEEGDDDSYDGSMTSTTKISTTNNSGSNMKSGNTSGLAGNGNSRSTRVQHIGISLYLLILFLSYAAVFSA